MLETTPTLGATESTVREKKKFAYRSDEHHLRKGWTNIWVKVGQTVFAYRLVNQYFRTGWTISIFVQVG